MRLYGDSTANYLQWNRSQSRQSVRTVQKIHLALALGQKVQLWDNKTVTTMKVSKINEKDYFNMYLMLLARACFQRNQKVLVII